MNTDRINRLADFLEEMEMSNEGGHFDMRAWMDIDAQVVTGGSRNVRLVTEMMSPGKAAEHFVDCGAVACVAGWACVQALDDGFLTTNEVERLALAVIADRPQHEIQRIAAQYLEIDEKTAAALFLPREIKAWGAIYAYDASAVLRRMAEEGHPDWGGHFEREIAELEEDC